MNVNGLNNSTLPRQIDELSGKKVDRKYITFAVDTDAGRNAIQNPQSGNTCLVKSTGRIWTYEYSAWGNSKIGELGVVYISQNEQYAYSQNQFFLLTTNNALTLGGVAASSYVQKDGSKGLSTNDYTNAEKNKLAGIDIDYNAQTVKANGKELGTIDNPILNATSSEFAESADKADADGDGNSITATYATKTELTNGLSGKLNTFQPSDVGKCVIIKNDGTLNPVSSAGMSVGYAENANDANTIDGHEYTDFATASHNHDGRYYTESEIDTALSGKAAASHTHDDRYYTTSQMDAALAAKAPSSHAHTKSQITDFAHEHQITQVTGLTTRLADIEDDVDSLESSTTGISSALSNHVNASNPHGITAAGIGAALSSHTHGNITNDGKVGSAANKPIITGTNGVLQAGSFGTLANTFCQGNDSRLSDARPASGGTAEYAEKLGSSGGSYTFGNINMQFSGINTSLTSLNTAVGNKVADVKIGNTSLLDSNKVASIPFANSTTDGVISKAFWSNLSGMYEDYNENGFQAPLVSGINIKTINGNSVLGSGNIVIQGGGGEANVIEAVKRNGTPLTVTDKAVDVSVPTQPSDIGAQPLIDSANKLSGSLISGYVANAQSATEWSDCPDWIKNSMSSKPSYTLDEVGDGSVRIWGDKQDTLVSGTNIKTINNQSLLGSGNIQAQGAYAEVNVTTLFTNQTSAQIRITVDTSPSKLGRHYFYATINEYDINISSGIYNGTLYLWYDEADPPTHGALSRKWVKCSIEDGYIRYIGSGTLTK